MTLICDVLDVKGHSLDTIDPQTCKFRTSDIIRDEIVCTTHQLEVESEGMNESANYPGGLLGGQIE